MTKKIFKSNFEMKSLNLNHIALRAVLMVLLVTCGVGEMWADPTYYYAKLTVQCKTGDGYVYAGKENTSDVQYGTGNSTDKIQTTTQNEAQTFFAWAMPGRGAEFAGWEKTSNINSLSGSSNPYTVTVKASSTDVTEGKLTATWTKYTKVNVTYNASEDGEYKVNYSYNSYDGITKTITAGDAEGLSCTINSENGNKTIGSYYNDVITLTSEKGTFLGWYSDAGFTNKLSDANPYTYVAPQSGTGSVYAKYPHVDKYYGRLKASIAEEPYSMPGGGMIFISKESAAAVEYSDEEQTVDNVGMGTTDLIYYLKAQPTDKRYVFRGWYSNPECTGTALSTNKEYTYTFTASSTNSASPTLGNIYAAFDFNLYYMQVEVEPAVPGLGMVLVKDNNTGTPDYTEYATNAEQFLFAYRLAPTANAYLYAKPKYGYKFSGWYDNPDCTGTAVGTANPLTYVATGTSTDPMNPTITKLYAKFVVDDAKVNITYNIPDQTKGEYTASVLDIAEVDDEFVWTFTEVYNSADYTTNTTLSQNKTDVLQLEAQPQAGYGVTSWTEGSTTKTTPSYIYETAGTAAKTLSVTFGEARPFLVGAANATTGTAYSTLREALDNLGNNKKITVVQNAYVPAGTYTIPSGVTLLVPYSEDYAVNTEPSVVTKGTPSRSVYVTLTLGDGAIINVSGSVCANAVMCLTMGYNGSAMGKYGLIDMNVGSQMNFMNSSNCYAWGYVIGEGQITAESGATIHETFQFKHRGGTALSSIAGMFSTESHKVFPINQYYIQSIETPILIKKGASEKVYTGVHNVDEAVSIDFIGTSGLFQLTGTNAYLIKQYDVNLDRQKYTLYGNATISSISFGMSGFNKESKDYVLPITNNMTLDIELGTTTIQYETALLPDVQVIIGSEAKVVASGNCYVYDSLNWKGAYAYACQYSAADQTTAQIAPVVYRHGGLKYDRKKHKLRDVTIDVQGEMSGNIYTTTGGANIMSSGSGKVTFSASRSATTTFQVGQDGSTPTWDAYSLTSAQLHNGDGSYVQTSDATDADQFIYSKVQERWMKNPKVISWDAKGGESEASTLAYSEGDFLGELPAAYKDGYTLEGWYTAADGGTKIDATTKVTANITYYAHWTPKSYSITYRDQGGVAFSGTHIDTPTLHPTTHTFGIATPLNGVENKTGYTYGGWYRTPSCSGTVVTTIPASTCKNITLYAKWKQNKVTVTWDATANGGSAASPATTDVTPGDAVGTLATTSKNGYTLAGWFTEPTGGTAVTAATIVSENKTFYAQFTEISHTVTLAYKCSSTSIKDNGSVNGVGITTSKSVTAPAITGYTFANWTLTDGVTSATALTNATISINATADSKTITANYTANTNTAYTVNHYKQNLDGAYPSTPTETQGLTGTTGASVTPAVKSYEGFTAPSAQTVTILADGSRVVTYNYTRNSYNLSWVTDGDALEGSYTNGNTKYGATITAPNTPTKTGYTFAGWSDGSSVVAPAETMPAENTTYTATWVASIADRELDIVDWTSNSITINVTNLKAEGGTNKNNWAIRVNDTDYPRKTTTFNADRTLTISGLTLTPNENLLIQLKNDVDVIESQHNYKIPQIYTANATLSETTSSSVVYVYGGKLAISGNTTLAALYVCPGAEVEVTSGTLTVGKLVLRTKPWATAAISGSVEATNIYYTRIAPDGSDSYPTGKYYQFGLPYECDINDVRLSDGTTPAYNTTWILKSYNEEKRATNGATGENWDALAADATIEAGGGYEMFSSYKYYREYYFPVTPTDNKSVSVIRHGDDKNNSGWNIVCSPLMSVYENKSNPVDGLKVSWLLPDGSYDQQWPETIWPALPFSYQASATGYLDFSTNALNQAVSAPRRAAYKDNIQTEWLHLDVKNANGVGDHTSIFAHPDRFDATYETGIDVAKQSFTASRALIYSSHVYGEMAFAGLPDSLLEHGVALTVYSPINQELTISMRENNWLNRMAYVLLIDKETGAQVDLMNGNYTFEALEGTMRGRFFIQCVFNAETPEISTGVNHLDTENDKAQKIVYKNKIYIIYQGRVYDMTGRQCELK